MIPMKLRSFYLTDELYDKLRALANKTRDDKVNISDHVRSALQLYVDSHESASRKGT